jgi:RNase P subunit RPR2
MTASLVPLSIPQTITIYRQKYPEALICTECGRLLAIRRESYVLTEEQRLAYVCAECRLDAREEAQQSATMRASFARSKELAEKSA